MSKELSSSPVATEFLGPSAADLQGYAIVAARIVSSQLKEKEEGVRFKLSGGAKLALGHIALEGQQLLTVRHSHNVKENGLVGNQLTDYEQQDTYYFIDAEDAGVKVFVDNLVNENSMLEQGEYEQLVEWRANKLERFASESQPATYQDSRRLSQLLHGV